MVRPVGPDSAGWEVSSGFWDSCVGNSFSRGWYLPYGGTKVPNGSPTGSVGGVESTKVGG